MAAFNHEKSLANHRITRWTFADATARLAKAGLTSLDVDKVAKQLSDTTYWIVTAVAAGVPTWAPLGSSAAGELLANKTNDMIVDSGSSVKYPTVIAVEDYVTAANIVIGNKRFLPRIESIVSDAAPAIDTDITDIFIITALAVDITSFTTNLVGLPENGELLQIIITGTAARAISWGSSFMSSTITLPSTTVTTNTLRVTLQYDTNYNKWVCVGVA